MSDAYCRPFDDDSDSDDYGEESRARCGSPEVLFPNTPSANPKKSSTLTVTPPAAKVPRRDIQESRKSSIVFPSDSKTRRLGKVSKAQRSAAGTPCGGKSSGLPRSASSTPKSSVTTPKVGASANMPNPKPPHRLEYAVPPPLVNPSASSSDTSPRDLSSALGEITNTLKTVVNRLSKTEARLESIEQQMKASKSPMSSSSESGHSRKPRLVPNLVRSETRKIYQTLLDEDEENFKGFDISQGVTFKDAANKEVVSRLIKEVIGLNPSFDAADIRSAAYTYYKSLSQQESLKRRGKDEQRRIQGGRRERLVRKLNQRCATFQQLDMRQVDQNKWGKVLTAEFMSSEESDTEDDVLVVKVLPWRADRVTRFFCTLDDTCDDERSAQGKRQTLPRVRKSGHVSTRLAPLDETVPSWAVATRVQQ